MRKATKTTRKMQPATTIGLDIGDKYCVACALDAGGDVLWRKRVATSETALRKHFERLARCRVVLEAGTHSPWMSRLLKSFGHEVLVANPRCVQLISRSNKKNDNVDAETLARLGRMDPELLAPIEHRSAEAQADLALLRNRDVLVAGRTRLINHVRAIVKTYCGRKVPSCSAAAFHNVAPEHIPPEIRSGLMAIIAMVESHTDMIRAFDKRIRALAKEYPETEHLTPIKGVAALTALAFVLTLEDARRFKSSRHVGAYLGLVPKLDNSAGDGPQLRITKAGDAFVRRLLVTASHYILGPHGPPCDLRAYGERIAVRGGKNAKKRAIIAVARKLAVLLHHLWLQRKEYDPHYNSKKQQAA